MLKWKFSCLYPGTDTLYFCRNLFVSRLCRVGYCEFFEVYFLQKTPNSLKIDSPVVDDEVRLL